MRTTVIICMVAALCSGCASTKTGGGNLMQRYAGSNQLAQAEEMLAKGDSAGATRVLSNVSSGPAVPGVTDEALFRLALLTLKLDQEKTASAQAQKLLKRLGKEYPKSPWTQLGAPLNELINLAEEQKRQNKSLKGANQSLTREINDLSKSIERLKHLDLELERKSR